MRNLVHDIFLLMSKLSQVKNQELILKLFIEAFNSMQQDFTLKLLDKDKPKEKNVIDIATTRYFFGRIAFDGETSYQVNEFDKLVRNAAQMLAIILENRELEKLLYEKNLNMKRRISEHEFALKQSEERYRNLYGAISCGVIVCNHEGKFIHANQAACNILGLSIDQLVGLSADDDSLWQAVYENGEEYPAELHPEMVTLRTGKPVQNAVMGIFSKDKSRLRWIVVNSQPMFDSKNIMEVVVSFIDITALKRAEEALYTETERLAITLHSIGDGVATTDNEGNIMLINKAAEELTGWKQEDAKGRNFNEVFHILDERTRENTGNPVARVLETRGFVDFGKNSLLIARSGKEIIISKSGAPILDSAGNITGVVLVFRDVTEVRKFELEVMRTDKLESLSILAGGIAHDFNNILFALVGNTSLVRMYAKGNSQIKETIDEIEKASYRARDLTNQLLTFARGGAPIRRTATITELIKETSEFALRGSNVSCSFTIPADLWPVEIDRGQISQVINNIVINAQHAMPDGGNIQIACANKYITEKDVLPLPGGKYLKMTIKDTGVGIPKEYRDKIFDPYFTTKQKGSGLGLATSYSIIKNHDGYIGVDSKVGQGTTFIIYLPASDKQLEIAETEKSIIKDSGKVLVMDDEQMVRNVAGKMLKYFGYQVEFAENGSQAIQLYKEAMLQKEPFDVVLMDLTVPGGMGGKETIKKLLELNPAIKAIVSSGYSNDPVMADYKAYGFSGVVLKPYRIEELSSVLRKISNS